MDQFFQESRFLCHLEQDGISALFHQLHPEPVYLPTTVWNAMDGRLPGNLCLNDLVVELCEKKMLIASSEIDQQELEVAQKWAIQLLDRPTILYLMLAQNCNFACGYCPIPKLAKQYGDSKLSWDDAVAGIQLWEKHIEDFSGEDSEPFFLVFYGGEPLLNRPVFEKVLPFVEAEKALGRLPQNLELMLCTNGILIDEELVKLLADHKVMVAVGIDGPSAINNKSRRTSAGEPTFAGIAQAIKILTANRVKVVASVIINAENIAILDEYPKFLQDLGVSKFGFNLLKGNALLESPLAIDPDSYYLAAAQGVLSGWNDAHQTDGDDFFEYQLEKKLTALRQALPFSIDCTCYGSQLVIQPDGQVTNCPFLRCDQGHVSELPASFRIADTKTVKAWRQRVPLISDRKILGKNYGMLDGGGCAWGTHELLGSVTATDAGNTVFTQEITHGLIWRILEPNRRCQLLNGQIPFWSYRYHRRIGPM
ncbi:MAG: radical SAM protein [Patescibacteria group bacterium]|jgi:sulfatase maturation enzyme AslB (radical SAM superfamily)